MDDSQRIAGLELALAEAKARIGELEGKALDLEDALVRAESQAEVLENFCFGLERDHELARRAIEERDAIIFSELEHARTFQQAMLATSSHGQNVTLEIAYRPLSQVGGDCYVVSRTSPSSFRLFIADATGHGIKAALQTMLIKAEYEVARVHAKGPSELLLLLNEKIHRAYRGIDMLFTAAVADVDLETGRVRYACAAHPRPFGLLGGRASELPQPQGTFMGLSDAAAFEEVETSIAPGDALVLVTDGIAEARQEVVGDFGDERILEAMEMAHASGIAITTAVCAALDTFVAPGAPDDDVTVIALRRH